LSALQGNSDGFNDAVAGAANDTRADSRALLSGAGLGVKGIVDLASDLASAVGDSLADTMKKQSESKMAMAALSSETNDLSNITQSQLAAVLKAMMDSQAMYDHEIEKSKTSNGESVALISGVIRDFVYLVNETLAESSDLISTVDANYTEQSTALDSKMNTIVGFINREANAVAASADSSSQALRNLLTSNGPMEDGIRQRLAALATQQDQFASKVHDQLNSFIVRLNDDNGKISSAREAATNRLYDALHKASTEFAQNAAAWQAERLSRPSTTDTTTLPPSTMTSTVTPSTGTSTAAVPSAGVLSTGTPLITTTTSLPSTSASSETTTAGSSTDTISTTKTTTAGPESTSPAAGSSTETTTAGPSTDTTTGPTTVTTTASPDTTSPTVGPSTDTTTAAPSVALIQIRPIQA
jgi:hypothetical protein